MSAASDEARALRAEHLILSEQVATQAAAQTRYADTMRERLAVVEAERDGWLAAAFDLQSERDGARRENGNLRASMEDARQAVDNANRAEKEAAGVAIAAIAAMNRAGAERDQLRAAVEALVDHARKISPTNRMSITVADLEAALGRTTP